MSSYKKGVPTDPSLIMRDMRASHTDRASRDRTHEHHDVHDGHPLNQSLSAVQLELIFS